VPLSSLNLVASLSSDTGASLCGILKQPVHAILQKH
jgi:hypothetical protein